MLDGIVVVAYLGFIVVVGTLVGKLSKTTSDFFFGGRRFAWWLVGFSCVATLVGSYSFIQYSQVGFKYGMASLGPYTNDWFVLPLFLGVWLPIFYYNRLESVPEYFEHRYDKRTRKVVIGFLIIYLTGYVGINLLTIGVAIKGIMNADPVLAQSIGFDSIQTWANFDGAIDWQLIVPAIIIAILSEIYLHAGGQTSVIVTDLIQGVLLLVVGLSVVWLGIDAVGGFGALWDGLPPSHRLPFANFNEPSEFHFVGDFWNDAAVGTFAFYLINQGILMRFLSARSVADGRKAMFLVVIVLMPLAAIAVGGAGWVGNVLVADGALPNDSAREIFIAVSRIVTQPGIYGLVIAAMIAALMSTLDTLITAVAAIVVNDIVRPMHPGREDAYYLRIAKRVALVLTGIGLLLIPVFNQFESIYRALSHFTSIVIPPLVVVVFLGVASRRFNAKAAFWTLMLGGAAILASLIWPAIITPIAHGVAPDSGYSYMRGLFGLIASGTVAMVMMFFVSTEAPPREKLAGLVAAQLDAALERFKGGKPSFEGVGRRARLTVRINDELDAESVRLPADVASSLSISPGDLLYVCDTRWWWGGLRSAHGRAVAGATENGIVEISPAFHDRAGFTRTLATVEKML